MSSLYDLIYSQSSERPEVVEDDDNAVDNFYFQDEQAAIPVSQETITFESPQQTAKAKPRRKRHPQEEETASQIERKNKKRREETEWKTRRHKWKKRKYTVQDEVDYGGAVAHAVAQMAKRDALGDQRVVPVASEPNTDDENTIPNTSASAEMDHYQRGLIAPLKVKYNYKSTFDASKQPEHDTQEEEGATISRIFDPKPRKQEPFFYFPLSSRACPTHGVFFHQRNLIGMAARTSHNKQLLRMLHTESFREAHRIRLLLAHARERAAYYVLYQKHDWRDRDAVMEKMGLGPRLEHMGPPHLVGYSLDRHMVYDSCRNKRQRLIKKHAINRINDAVKLVDQTAEEDVPDNEDSDDAKEVRVSNMESASALEGPEEGKPTKIVPVTTDYQHLPGSIPPVPLFPTNEHGFIFGSASKYAWMLHAANVDSTTLQLGLSNMLGELGETRAIGGNEAVQKHEQIMAYLEATLTNIGIDRSKQVFLHQHDLPIVPFYNAVMDYSSYLANSGGFVREQRKTEDYWGSDSDSDGHASDNHREKENSLASFDLLASLVFDRLELLIHDKRLEKFPRAFLTIGIARIIKELPPLAAEMLSRPCGSETNRTVFELMQATLEHVESEGLLVDSVTLQPADNSVNVGHLEHSFHLAADLFHKCLDVEPTEIIYHQWYIAALSGSLLLCSGNAIGSGARCCPSSKPVKSGHEFRTSPRSRSSIKAYQVRRKLDKFDEVREQLIEAMTTVIDLTGSHPNRSRMHLTISSLLEWREVTALIVGPRCCNENATDLFEKARRLHAFHTVQWSLVERSHSCYLRVKDLACKKEAIFETQIAVAAALLEDDCSNVENWRRLVDCLGPLGEKVSKPQRLACKQRSCIDCKMLRRGFNVNHNKFHVKENHGWWGKGREWWHDHILCCSYLSESTKYKDAEAFFEICAAIENKLLSADVKEKRCSSANLDCEWAGVGLNVNQDIDGGWLSLPEVEDDSSDSCDSDYGARELHTLSHDCVTRDAELPRTFAEVLNGHASTAVDPHCMRLQLSSSYKGFSLEVLCYKAFITCHLSNAAHPLISKCTWYLAQNAWDTKLGEVQECDEWNCIDWLYSMGLNVPLLLHEMFLGIKPKKKRKT